MVKGIDLFLWWLVLTLGIPFLCGGAFEQMRQIHKRLKQMTASLKTHNLQIDKQRRYKWDDFKDIKHFNRVYQTIIIVFTALPIFWIMFGEGAWWRTIIIVSLPTVIIYLPVILLIKGKGLKYRTIRIFEILYAIGMVLCAYPVFVSIVYVILPQIHNVLT